MELWRRRSSTGEAKRSCEDAEVEVLSFNGQKPVLKPTAKAVLLCHLKFLDELSSSS